MLKPSQIFKRFLLPLPLLTISLLQLFCLLLLLVLLLVLLLNLLLLFLTTAPISLLSTKIGPAMIDLSDSIDVVTHVTEIAVTETNALHFLVECNNKSDSNSVNKAQPVVYGVVKEGSKGPEEIAPEGKSEGERKKIARSRRKRFIAFPDGSTFSTAICITTGVIGNPEVSYLSMGLNWGIAYDLPNATWILQNANGFHNKDTIRANKQSTTTSIVVVDENNNNVNDDHHRDHGDVHIDNAFIIQRRHRRELYRRIEILIKRDLIAEKYHPFGKLTLTALNFGYEGTQKRQQQHQQQEQQLQQNEMENAQKQPQLDHNQQRPCQHLQHHQHGLSASAFCGYQKQQQQRQKRIGDDDDGFNHKEKHRQQQQQQEEQQYIAINAATENSLNQEQRQQQQQQHRYGIKWKRNSSDDLLLKTFVDKTSEQSSSSPSPSQKLLLISATQSSSSSSSSSPTSTSINDLAITTSSSALFSESFQPLFPSKPCSTESSCSVTRASQSSSSSSPVSTKSSAIPRTKPTPTPTAWPPSLKSKTALPFNSRYNRILKRPKRYLAFPEGSSLSVAVCITVGIIGNPSYNYMSFGLNWGVAYDLPNSSWVLNHLHGFSRHPVPPAVLRRRTRRKLYNEIENAVENMGYNGRDCVLRALCESRKYFNDRKMGMIGEMLRVVFSLPKQRLLSRELHENSDIKIYDHAYRSARSVHCAKAYRCPFSLLELAVGRYSTPPKDYYKYY